MDDHGAKMCRCGCDRPVPIPAKGSPADYIKGHSNRKYPHEATCTVRGCDRPPEAKGLCHSHFEYQRRTGKTPRGPILDTDEARFMAKVKKLPSGHWMWTGARNGDGRYGIGTVDGKQHNAHRCAWLLFRGPIPEGMVLDHLCRVTLCVNPEHLQVVTQQVNVIRGDSPTGKNAAKTQCIHGHEFTPRP